jgi:NADH dehydrogenase (ubiquinone) 1 alpha subcomplex subunit 12
VVRTSFILLFSLVSFPREDGWFHANERWTDIFRARFESDRQLDGRKGELVGVDAAGNSYYENRAYQQGRSRWVVMKDLDDYSAANVPAEWHGWLHHINDEPGLENAVQPIFADDHPAFIRGRNASGIHLPKGHFLRPGSEKRSWAKYSPWVPN